MQHHKKTFSIFTTAKKNRFLALIFASLMVIVQPSFVYAELSPASYPMQAIRFYSIKGCLTGVGEGGAGAGTALVGNDNIEKVLRFFVGKGLSLKQAAAIAGNLEQESRINPTIENSIDAYGIAQWLGGRKNNLKAKSNYNTLETQLEFLWEELNGVEKAGLEAIKNDSGSDVGKLAVEFGEKFERYGAGEEGKRAQYANEIYTSFQSKIPDSSSSGGSSSSGSGGSQSSGSNCTGIGGSNGGGSYMDDSFIVHNQCDQPWANLSYGSNTICSAGCGPSAMSNIITAMTGKKVTPEETSKFAADNGMAHEWGSSWDVSPKLAEHWGLKAKNIANDVTAINEALRGGALVNMSGAGPSPFIAGGHFIVIRGVTNDGKWKIADSNGQAGQENSKKEWDPNAILPYARQGNVWAITK